MLSHREFLTKTPGILTVSIYPNFFPIAYQDDNEYKGLDVDIITLFARAANFQIIFKPKVNFNDIWFDPIRGVSDVSIGGIGISPERTTAETSWTLPYFYVERTIVYNKKDPIIKFPADVNRTILGVPASTGFIDGKLKLQAVNKSHYLLGSNNDKDDIERLRNGSVQGLLRGSFVAKAIVEEYPNELGMTNPWKIDPNLVSSDGEVFAFPCYNRSGIAVGLSSYLIYLKCGGILDELLQKYGLL